MRTSQRGRFLQLRAVSPRGRGRPPAGSPGADGKLTRPTDQRQKSVQARRAWGRLGVPPSPVDYAIYGIIHSACGAHRKPAAIHRYVPPGCIRNGVTCSLIGMSGRSRTVSEVPGHRLGVPGVLYRWSSAVWDYASREASSPSALRVCSISGRIPNLARMMIVDWEPPSSRMRRTRFS